MPRISACTIIAGNYRPAARVLAESFFAHHPDSSFAALVVDDPHREIAPETEVDRRIEWWRPEDLGLDTAELHRLAAIYDVTELSTSLKPLFLKRLLRTRGSAILYLDPDILIFDALDDVARLADRHGLVLTPHMTRPIPDDGRGVDALAVLAAGVYNLGFIAVSPTADACLDWWWQQTRRRAISDVQHQMFTDQRWADYMPSLFDHHLLKDPGCNVAYWNLHERPLKRCGDRLHARGERVRFFHFSGFDPRTPWLLSRHQGERPRILLSEHPVLESLCAEYARRLELAGHEGCGRRAYGWGTSADGLEMTPRIRRLCWAAVMEAERSGEPEPPDPFDATDPGAFTAWLNEPMEPGPHRWSRYVRAIYAARADVQTHFTEIEGRGAAWFDGWLRIDGVAQERIPPALLPAALDREGTHAQEDASSLRRGVHLTGYLRAELGVGEAGRLMTRAIAATGEPWRATIHRRTASRQEHPFDEPADAPEDVLDIDLLCMNADATLDFARQAAFARGPRRYRIGYWFWEVDPLPLGLRAAFDHVDEVWAATDYVADILRSAPSGRKPVFTVPLPLLPPRPLTPCARAQLGLPEGRFVFLFLFDFLSVMERKNPLGAIEAFCAAFAPDEGPLLVLKSINGDARLPELEQLRHAAARRPDVVIRDGYMSEDERNALMTSCDAYVSLHRSEGLGLTLAEAMSLGKPTIATGFSGNRHFMTDENSFLVDFRVVTLTSACGPYPAGSSWAEPDLSHAARLMRAVVEHPDEAARRAERGRADILFRHGVMTSAAAVSARLAAIRATPTEVPAPSVAAPMAPEPREVLAEPSAALAAALPALREMTEVRLGEDDRPGRWLRRGLQRVLFRFIRPYAFQQRKFQNALLDALQASSRGSGPSGEAERR